MDETVLYLPKLYGVLTLKSVRRQLIQIIVIVIYKTKIKFYIIFVSTWRAGSLIQEQKIPLVEKFAHLCFTYVEDEIKIVTYEDKELVRNKPLSTIDKGKRTKNRLR
jgi:hypothetical protein